MLLPVLVSAFVLRTIRPLFNAFPVLFVFIPLTDISGAVRVLVGAVPVGLVVQPLALVDVSVGVDEGAVAVGLVSLPLPVIFGAVLPHLLAVSVFHSVQELASIDGSVTEGDGAEGLAHSGNHFSVDSIAVVELAVLERDHPASARHAVRDHVVDASFCRLEEASSPSLAWVLTIAVGGVVVIRGVLVGVELLVLLHGVAHLVLADGVDSLFGRLSSGLLSEAHASTISHL